jgi:enoyl-CoA hydratase/carnithine racemase
MATDRPGPAGPDPAGLVLADLDAAGVLTLTWNRPERRNGWSAELEDAYLDRLEQAAADPAVRVVGGTGAGTTFCPGADLARLDDLAAAGTGLDLAGRRPPDTPLRFPKPLVAAVNGGCAGVGLVQALMCDVRFAADTARFSTAFARRGLIAEYGLSWVLPRLVGVENALDLLLSGRTVDAAEARSLGLVSRVVPAADVLAAARAYAADVALHCSPRSTATIRSQVLGDLHGSYDEALSRAVDLMQEFLRGPDLAEGVASFRERRPPRFPGLPPHSATGDPVGP